MLTLTPRLCSALQFALCLVVAFLVFGAYSGAKQVPEKEAQTTGMEFVVNNTDYDVQASPDIYESGNHHNIIAWHGFDPQDTGYAIYQRTFFYDQPSTILDDLVSDPSEHISVFPAIAGNGGSNHVVAWSSSESDGSGYGVRAAYFPNSTSEDGKTIFDVNTFTEGDQTNVDVAMSGDRIIVVWASYDQEGGAGDDTWGIYGQLFDFDGNPVGSEFLVNQRIEMDQNFPSVATHYDGRFVVVFESEEADLLGSGIVARTFNADGTAADDEFVVNVLTGQDQLAPSVAMDSDANFIVAWQGPFDTTYNNAIFVNKIAFDGTFLLTTEAQVSDAPDMESYDAYVCVNWSTGQIGVIWQEKSPSSTDPDIYSQVYDSALSTKGSPFLVNETRNGIQSYPAASWNFNYGLTTVWHSEEADNESWFDIVGRRFGYCDETCDDTLFCNGAESCIEDVCTGGVPPCAIDEVCVEEFDICVGADDDDDDDDDDDTTDDDDDTDDDTGDDDDTDDDTGDDDDTDDTPCPTCDSDDDDDDSGCCG